MINNGSDKFNDVSLSVIAKIEKTGFTYDMMSINEVFDFPKIWYRRSLARRLFLGEEPSTSNQSQLNRNSQSPQTPFTEPQAQNNRGTFEGTKRSNKRLLHTNNSPSWKTCVLLSVSLSTLDVKMNVGKIMGEITWITKNPVLFSKMYHKNAKIFLKSILVMCLKLCTLDFRFMFSYVLTLTQLPSPQ